MNNIYPGRDERKRGDSSTAEINGTDYFGWVLANYILIKKTSSKIFVLSSMSNIRCVNFIGSDLQCVEACSLPREALLK